VALETNVRSRFVSVDGRRVHILQAGAGAPVVLVHGIAASVIDWHLNLPALAQHFAVTAVDLPGFGESEIPPLTDPIADAIRFLGGLLDGLGLERAALVGNSMGGLICGHFAIAHPERVTKLLLVDPAGLDRDVSLHFRLLTVPLLGEWALQPRPSSAQLAARGLFANPARAPSVWIADKALDRGPAARAYLLKALRGGANFFGLRPSVRMLAGLRALTLPICVVWGDQDHVIPPYHLQLVKQQLPAARTYLLRDAGHVPMLEHPDEFNRVATAFLTEPAA